MAIRPYCAEMKTAVSQELNKSRTKIEFGILWVIYFIEKINYIILLVEKLGLTKYFCIDIFLPIAVYLLI
ncbi:hypothetical protein [Okeania sp. SIO2C2]|uniref:hypothetical protein n=1 Tax=Okeania sp. SIO2C2 TaxID=2607787 RepID=UPI0025807AB1|nr:hypothetical protein [Okeania sp. SIO2C2]